MTNQHPTQRIEGADEAWESGALGTSMEHAATAPAELQQAIDASLGMQSISIRLPKQLIDAYKLIAAYHSVGYQPLMRDMLQRAVPELMKEVVDAHTNRAAEVDHRIEEMRKVA